MSGLSRFTEPPATGGSTPAGRATDVLDEADAPLRRFLRPRPVTGDACEMCAESIGQDHRHVVDLEQRGILCTCRGCGLLFDRTDVSTGRYRTVPDRILRVEPFELPPVAWASLQIPVGMAFVVHNSQLGAPVAFYPSPGGATESELPLRSWTDIVADNPVLDDVATDVEAVLLRHLDDRVACFVVPVDRCYELVGRLRTTWRGFDGGSEARAAQDAFFAELDRRARTAPGGGP